MMVRLIVTVALLLVHARLRGDELAPAVRSWMQSTLGNWEATCVRHLKIDPRPLPWIIFYDEKHAWHVNPEAERLPDASPTGFALSFAGAEFPVHRVTHSDGTLWTPSGRPLPLVPRAATMAYDENTRPFFILALPSFWRTLPGAAKFPRLDEFLLGVASHEITHTRQIVDVAKRLDRAQKAGLLPAEIDDDVIEHTFRTDTAYAERHRAEVGLLYEAVFARDPQRSKALIREALAKAEKRRERFFRGERHSLREAEEVFVVMEGFAEWCQLQVLREAEPELSYEAAVHKLRGNDVPWVQDYGLALFVLIDRHVPGWPALFLKPDFPSPFSVLGNAIGPSD